MKDYLKVFVLFLLLFLVLGFFASIFDGESRAERKAEREAEIEAAYEKGYEEGYNDCLDEYGISTKYDENNIDESSQTQESSNPKLDELYREAGIKKPSKTTTACSNDRAYVNTLQVIQ